MGVLVTEVYTDHDSGYLLGTPFQVPLSGYTGEAVGDIQVAWAFSPDYTTAAGFSLWYYDAPTWTALTPLDAVDVLSGSLYLAYRIADGTTGDLYFGDGLGSGDAAFGGFTAWDGATGVTMLAGLSGSSASGGFPRTETAGIDTESATEITRVLWGAVRETGGAGLTGNWSGVTATAPVSASNMGPTGGVRARVVSGYEQRSDGAFPARSVTWDTTSSLGTYSFSLAYGATLEFSGATAAAPVSAVRGRERRVNVRELPYTITDRDVTGRKRG